MVTEDRVIQQVGIGDRGLGAAWLLLFLGPIGWIGLIAISLLRRPLEVLQVVLPMSEAAQQREAAARKLYREAVALAALGGFGLFAALVTPWNGSPAVGLLIGVAVFGALVAGLVGSVIGHARLNRATVQLGLDASRRWVTISRVHPNFAAEAGRTALHWQEN